MYEEAAEVAEAGFHTVNMYLDAGYELLSIQPKHKVVAQHKQEGEKRPNPMVLRSICYVVARRADVPHYDPPSRAERIAAEQTQEQA